MGSFIYTGDRNYFEAYGLLRDLRYTGFFITIAIESQ